MRSPILILQIIVIYLFFISCNSQQAFKQLEYNEKEEIIKQIAVGIIPKNKNIGWALVKGDEFYKKAEVLFKSKIEEKSFEYFSKGFFNACDPLGCSYYIAIKKEDKLTYIKDQEKLLIFLGDINTLEEALLIAIINDFQIDLQNQKGSSYRNAKNTFEFLLMKPEYPAYEFRQYQVNIDRYGNLNEEEKGVYCKGVKECENL